MSALDVVKMHTGLQTDYGLDAGYLSNVSSTSSTYLLSPNGLPLNVGWFDNSQKSLKGRNVYALTTYPAKPANMHHRIMIEQVRGDNSAVLVEQDDSEYLEGYDDFPHILHRDRLQQPEVDKTTRGLTLGAYVLNSTTGKSHEKFAWSNDYDVPTVREHGLEIITAGNILAVIDQATLDRYAQLEPPVLH